MKNWKTIPLGYNQGRTNVEPFAGLYPTRWKIEGEYTLNVRGQKSDQRFSYLGKPNPTVALRLRYIFQRAPIGSFSLKEFDRGGLLAYADTYPPRLAGQILATDWNSVFRFYYPWMSGSGELVTSWGIGRTIHRVIVPYQGRAAVIYSEHSAANIAVQTWQEHKTWLNRNALQLAKPR
jgi:hypothetical protein